MATTEPRDWPAIGLALDREGYAVLPGLLAPGACAALAPHTDLAASLHSLIQGLYPHLDAINRSWHARMLEPPTHAGEHAASGRVTWSRRGTGEQCALHQAPVVAGAFLLEVSILLSRPGVDFTGGEFVMKEQRPRMQSRPIVVSSGVGDGVIYAAGTRPFQGARGMYKVNMKHAICRVLAGERTAVTIDFPMSGAQAA